MLGWDNFSVVPMDYERLSTILMFDSCTERSCASVNIVDDLILENIESFFASLTRSTGLDIRITLDPVNAEIEITDDDGTRTTTYSS